MSPTKKKYWSATGRRKRASAFVKIFSGTGQATINKNMIEKPEPVYLAPLKLLGLEKKFDLTAQVKGGGKIAQKTAICLGVARALVKKDSELKPTLRKAGFLTRDPREKERKKPGLKRARRAPQWQKR